jgi:hypothetical protein
VYPGETGAYASGTGKDSRTGTRRAHSFLLHALHPMIRRTVAVRLAPMLALLLLSACAAAETGAARQGTRSRPDVLTREEIASVAVTNLYSAVERLRPAWLRARGGANLQGPTGAIVVFQNDVQLGGLEALRQLPPEVAESLRFLDGTTASNTLPGLGSRAVAGAIIIVTPGRR